MNKLNRKQVFIQFHASQYDKSRKYMIRTYFSWKSVYWRNLFATLVFPQSHPACYLISLVLYYGAIEEKESTNKINIEVLATGECLCLDSKIILTAPIWVSDESLISLRMLYWPGASIWEDMAEYWGQSSEHIIGDNRSHHIWKHIRSKDMLW